MIAGNLWAWRQLPGSLRPSQHLCADSGRRAQPRLGLEPRGCHRPADLACPYASVLRLAVPGLTWNPSPGPGPGPSPYCPDVPVDRSRAARGPFPTLVAKPELSDRPQPRSAMLVAFPALTILPETPSPTPELHPALISARGKFFVLQDFFFFSFLSWLCSDSVTRSANLKEAPFLSDGKIRLDSEDDCALGTNGSLLSFLEPHLFFFFLSLSHFRVPNWDPGVNPFSLGALQ